LCSADVVMRWGWVVTVVGGGVARGEGRKGKEVRVGAWKGVGLLKLRCAGDIVATSLK
jgi:hypothetical protein